MKSILLIILLTLPAGSATLEPTEEKRWRAWWSLGYGHPWIFPTTVIPFPFTDGALGSQIALYHPVGDQFLFAGLALTAMVDSFGSREYRDSWTWAIPLNLNVSALQFDSREKAQGWFYRLDLGVSHVTAKKSKRSGGGWTFTGDGFGGMGWNVLAGLGYAWNESWFLQVNFIIRQHFKERPETTQRKPYDPYVYPHHFLSIGKRM